MPTRGGFSAWTERAKDVIVQELRKYLSLEYANVLKEMPQIERYGLAGQTSIESFVNIFTALPHEEQRIPFIAVMSAPGVERKMGVGRQVIHTFHSPDTGLPMIRETVGGDMTVILELMATDTNMRAELTDIVYSFFTVYMEQTAFSFLGDSLPEKVSGVPALYQLILKSAATLGGETDHPRPEGEPFSRIYFNRISVPIIFLDYVDREADDISVCFDGSLEPEDDEQFKYRDTPIPIPEPDPMMFLVHDNFEDPTAPEANWIVKTNPSAIVERITDEARTIKGNGSILLQAYEAGGLATLSSRTDPSISGRLRLKFNLTDGKYGVLLYCMLQGTDPFTDECYQLIVKNGTPSRLAIVKGVIGTDTYIPMAEGSRIHIPTDTDLAAQLEWKIDTKRNRIRLRGYVASCDSSDFGSMLKRLEIYDTVDAFLTTNGEGFGFRPNPDAESGSGAVVIDDAEIITEIITINQSVISPRIGW